MNIVKIDKQLFLTQRQSELLEIICREYIKLGKPVSSSLISKKYDLGLSPAAIRLEMNNLEKKGYIFQPHISAGRLPADSAYRLFVNNILSELEEFKKNNKAREIFESAATDAMKKNEDLLRSISKILSDLSHGFGLAGFWGESFFHTHDFKKFFQDSDFEEKDILKEAGEILDILDGQIDKGSPLGNISSLSVYIGREIPLKKIEHFSFIASPVRYKNKKGLVGILGNKRMDYEKNINLVKEVQCLLEEF